MKNNMKIRKYMIAFCVLVLLAYSQDAQAQERVERIGDREYQLVDSRWIYVSEIGDTVRFSPRRIIVRFRDHVIDTAVVKERLHSITELKVASGPTRGGYYVLHVPENRGFDVMRFLKEDSYVESVTFSVYGEWLSTPNDPRWSDQWNLPKVSMPFTWDITRGDPDVIIAIIDSGARLDHEDLENSIWSGTGYNFLNPSTDPTDSYGHGTTVAGIAGAQTNNSKGVAGIAGQWNSTSGSRLMILHVGTTAPIIEHTASAIEWAADNGASVINLSLSHPNEGILQSAVNYAIGEGVTIVAAAGNNGGNSSGDKSIRYPARYSNVVAVGATVEDDTRWVSSGFGGSAIGSELDLMAPGGESIIWTTNMNGGYSEFSGTSASAPHVAGVAAFMKSVNPSLTSSQVQAILRGSADWLSHMGGSPPNNDYGHGRLNAFEAVKAALPVQLDSYYFSGNATLNSTHIFAESQTETMHDYGTLTIPSGKVVVIDDSYMGGGAQWAEIVVNGRLVIHESAYVLGL